MPSASRSGAHEARAPVQVAANTTKGLGRGVYKRRKRDLGPWGTTTVQPQGWIPQGRQAQAPPPPTSQPFRKCVTAGCANGLHPDWSMVIQTLLCVHWGDTEDES